MIWWFCQIGSFVKPEWVTIDKKMVTRIFSLLEWLANVFINKNLNTMELWNILQNGTLEIKPSFWVFYPL